MQKSEIVVVKKSVDFGLVIIEFCELLEDKGKYIIA
ncbi:hypothetical protein KCTC52924_01261 [Arenibacter antarcticus]